MTDVVADVRKVIEDRLRELESEEARLRRALADLGGGTRGAPTRRRPRATSAGGHKRAGARRAPRGQREAEFLAALKKNPGAKASEIAREMGVAPSQVYGLAGRLHKEGKVRKRRGGGYALKDSG